MNSVNADVEIKFSLLLKTRQTDERFKLTTTATETWVLNSTIQSYKDPLEPLLNTVFNYAQLQRQLNINTEVGCHYTIRIDNITAPTPPTGAWVQAKEHFDGALSDGDFNSIDVLRSRIYTAMDSIVALAKYG